jgi:predicted nucleotidyltransferase
MSKKDESLQIAEAFSAEMSDLFGDGLIGIALIGSAARGDFIPGKSDVNTLIVLSSIAIDQLEIVYPVLKSFRRKNLAAPLFMTPDSISNSLDSYPLEFLDFKIFHRIFHGVDFLESLVIPKQPLRLQIERELRGKLLLLRQIYASNAKVDKNLAQTLHQSGKLFTVVFQGILELENRSIPARRQDLFREAASLAKVSDKVYQELLDVRHGLKKQSLRELYKTVLAETNQLVDWIDGYTI